MTGRLLESIVFGKTTVAWEGEMRYLPYKEAFTFCKEHQPCGWNPTDPPTRAGSNLYASIALKLEETIGEFDWEKELRFFSAIGSPLDVFHGIDGWFEFQGRVVTFDLTANTAKADGYKAKVILLYEDDDNSEITLHGIERIPDLLLGAA
jgi:hypothetical protein